MAQPWSFLRCRDYSTDWESILHKAAMLRSGIEIGTQEPCTEQQCFVQALTLNPKDEYAWNNLGNPMGVGETAQIGKAEYAKQQCYVQALMLNPKHVDAWNDLGLSPGFGLGWESSLYKAAVLRPGIDIEP